MLYDLGVVSIEEVREKADRAHESWRSRASFSQVHVAALVQAAGSPWAGLLDAVAGVIDHDWEGTDTLAASASGIATLPVKPPAPVVDFECENNALAAMAQGGKIRIRPGTIVMPNGKHLAVRHDVLVLA